MTNYVMNPLVVFQRFINYKHRSREFKRGFEAGCMAMALELRTVVKTLEALPGDSEETISTIHTFLTSLELSELSEEWYNRIAEARRLHFVAEPDALPHGTASSEQPSAEVHGAHASELVSRYRGEQASPDIPASPALGQSPDRPSSSSAQLSRGAALSRRIGSPLSPGGIAPPADESE